MLLEMYGDIYVLFMCQIQIQKCSRSWQVVITRRLRGTWKWKCWAKCTRMLLNFLLVRDLITLLNILHMYNLQTEHFLSQRFLRFVDIYGFLVNDIFLTNRVNTRGNSRHSWLCRQLRPFAPTGHANDHLVYSLPVVSCSCICMNQTH